jgi:hypothetical protein
MVMTGALDFWTTSRSGETIDVCTKEACGAGCVFTSFSVEQPLRIAAAPAKAVRAISRRLMDAEFFFPELVVEFPELVVEQDPHALVPQSPQPPPALLITGNSFSIKGSF